MEKIITEQDVEKLPKIMKMIEEESEFIQLLYDYAQKNYENECYRYGDECPDETNLPDELYYKQVCAWFISEKKMPSKGVTVLEEFVEKFMSHDHPDMAERFLRMGDPIRGSFRIINRDYYPLMLVEKLVSGERYVTVSRIRESRAERELFTVGGVVRGKIYRWWDTYYMFNGVLSRVNPDYDSLRYKGLILNPEDLMEVYERSMIQKYESILVSNRTKLSSAMNKFPSFWVDGICSATGIDKRIYRTKAEKIRAIVSKLENGYAMDLLEKKFTKNQLAALKKVYQNGWVIKYGQLTKDFSFDIGLFWNEHPPTSEIGILRQYGFLIVGRIPNKGRLYRVALIPLELRQEIQKFFSK